jgi:hypothetical protein
MFANLFFLSIIKMLSNQGLVVAALSGVQIATVASSIILMKEVTLSSRIAALAVSLIVMGIGAFISVYSIDCMIKGQCNLFAWVLVGFMLLSFTMALVSSFRQNKEQK